MRSAGGGANAGFSNPGPPGTPLCAATPRGGASNSTAVHYSYPLPQAPATPLCSTKPMRSRKRRN
jgi:hypothetical protein